MVKIPRFYATGTGSIPGQGARSHMPINKDIKIKLFKIKKYLE